MRRNRRTLSRAFCRGRTVAPLRHAYGAEIRWHRQRVDGTSHRRQDEAVALYGGELVNLGLRGRWGRVHRRVAGEWIGVGQKVPVPDGLALT